MAMNQASSGNMQSDINVTPMIDVLLVLLIIFMVIVPVTSKGESARIPQPSNGGRQDTPVVLEVLKDGAHASLFRINQQPVSREELAPQLEAIYANRAERVLFVKGDDELSFTQIAEVIDIGHAAGVEHVGLMTPKVAAGQ